MITMKAVQLFSTKIGIESLPMLVRHNLLTGANTLINRRSGEILNFSAYTIDQFTITNDGRYASIIDDSDPTDSTRIMMQTIGSDSYQAIDIPPTGYIQRGGSSMRMTPNGQFVGDRKSTRLNSSH